MALEMDDLLEVINVIESFFLYLRGFSSGVLSKLFFICHRQSQTHSTWSYVYVLELSPGADSGIDPTAFQTFLLYPPVLSLESPT